MSEADQPDFDDTDRTRILEQTFDRQLGWISGVDRRVGFVFAANVAMLGVLVRVAGTTFTDWLLWTAIAGFCIAGSLVFLGIAMLPDTDGTDLSKIFFGGISNHGVDQYEAEMRKLTRDEYMTDLASQCHVNARIADRKYRFVKWSMWAMSAAVFFWALALATVSPPQPATAANAAVHERPGEARSEASE